jgi:hypothetical protein
MKLSDYELFTNGGDKYPTIGFCPFCGQPGWITGDDNWCYHYVGTSNGYSAAGPLGVSVFPRIQELPISQLLEKKITEYKELPLNEQSKIINRVIPKYRDYLKESIENDWLSTAFLDFFHDYKYLDCEFDGPGFTEHCVSFFVFDYGKLQKSYTRLLTSILTKLQPKVNS